jgi:hypothetical protein
MDDDVPRYTPASADVLPVRARRRRTRRDAVLPALLVAEMLLGMVLGAVWETREHIPLLRTPRPAVLVADHAAPSVDAVPARPLAVTAPVPAATRSAPPRRTVPRSPFELQSG